MNPKGLTHYTKWNQLAREKQICMVSLIGRFSREKKVKLTETERRMVVARGWCWAKQGEVGKSIRHFSYKMSKA